jgi:hypothetical protein
MLDFLTRIFILKQTNSALVASTLSIKQETERRVREELSEERTRLREDVARYEHLWREELQRHADTRKRYTSISQDKRASWPTSVSHPCGDNPSRINTSDKKMKRLSLQVRHSGKENLMVE